MKNHVVEIDKSKCIGCGLCKNTCAAHNIELKNKKAGILLDSCLMCGQCTAICPKEAITISGYGEEVIPKGENVRLNPDEVLEVIRFRRTIRQFKDKEIKESVINQILEAGRLTHTAKNMQDVSFIVLNKNKEKVEQMAVRLFKRIKPLADLFSPMARNTKINNHFFSFMLLSSSLFWQKKKQMVFLLHKIWNLLLKLMNLEYYSAVSLQLLPIYHGR